MKIFLLLRRGKSPLTFNLQILNYIQVYFDFVTLLIEFDKSKFNFNQELGLHSKLM